MAFRYILDTSSKKHKCNKCFKNTMVRYIDTEKNVMMPLDFGRCDREQKCGYLNTPTGSFSQSVEYIYVPPLEPSYLDINLIQASGRSFKNNNFIKFLKTLFSEEQVKEVIIKYLLGTSKVWNGSTIFWQLDNFNRLRHGKIMLYNELTGKREKNTEGKPYINSVKSLLRLKNFNLQQCLFGLHLIKGKEIKSIAVVESEKTAVIMSLFKPEYVWLATGSKSGFKYEYLKEIRDYNIVGFPDKSEYYDWLNKSIELNKLGFKIKVSDFLENTEYTDGTDLADVYINVAKNNSKEGLQIIETNCNQKAKLLFQKNKSLKLLINMFDLTDKNGLDFNL
jgi:hypothetical protein